MFNMYFSFRFNKRMLTLPSDTRARHKMTYMGHAEAARIYQIHTRLLQSIVVRMGHLAEICEVLKQEGLPPNEVWIFLFVQRHGLNNFLSSDSHTHTHTHILPHLGVSLWSEK
jgi:hypothetical protein